MKRAIYRSSFECYEREYGCYQTLSSLECNLSDVTVLDVGCGAGIETYRFGFENPSWTITGIDCDTELIKRAKEGFWSEIEMRTGAQKKRDEIFLFSRNGFVLKKPIRNVNFFVADYDCENIPGVNYDLIFAYSCGLELHKKSFKYVLSLLKPEGILLTENNSYNSLGYLLDFSESEFN